MARLLSLVTIVALGFGAGIVARPQGPQGRGPQMYDRGTESTYTGTISVVETVAGAQGTGRRGLGGLHVTLKTSSESVIVHLGPVDFLNKQKLTVAAGDEVEITGSRVTMGGETVLLARQVRKGSQSWTLRDASGRPLWAGPPPRP